MILVFCGFFLLGDGLTGYVISQNCCFGEDCGDENLCNANIFHEPEKTAYIGMVFVAVALMFFVVDREKIF